MSEFFFGCHSGHLNARADKIAQRHGASHHNHIEPGTGIRRGWFACDNRGWLHDEPVMKAVMADIDAAGGIDGLRLKRDAA